MPFDPFVLSAERLGISLFYRELDFSKSQLVDLLQKFGGRKEDEDRSLPFFLVDQTFSRYARPIKDNIDYTRSIPDLHKQRSEIYGDGFFNGIKKLMNGYFAVSSDAIEFRSVGRGERRFAVPLHLASSSARGLSDLYFFLRHVARRNQLLIIDEPESHLDTANQYLRSLWEIDRETPLNEQRISIHYSILFERTSPRLAKQGVRAVPTGPVGTEEYKGLTIRTSVGTSVHLASLTNE